MGDYRLKTSQTTVATTTAYASKQKSLREIEYLMTDASHLKRDCYDLQV
jgi:hypothetical protein